jgi:hypothetical protein
MERSKGIKRTPKSQFFIGSPELKEFVTTVNESFADPPDQRTPTKEMKRRGPAKTEPWFPKHGEYFGATLPASPENFRNASADGTTLSHSRRFSTQVKDLRTWNKERNWKSSTQ